MRSVRRGYHLTFRVRDHTAPLLSLSPVRTRVRIVFDVSNKNFNCEPIGGRGATSYNKSVRNYVRSVAHVTQSFTLSSGLVPPAYGNDRNAVAGHSYGAALRS